MCLANATLFYGLWVTTASLNFAAAAHKATRGPVLAIDLITRRRRSGKLEVEGQGARTTARELPEEVWLLVKHDLIKQEMLQAEVEAVSAMRCEKCSSGPCDGSDEGDHEIWTHWECPLKDCEECWLAVIDAELDHRSPEQRSDVVALLACYRLALPSDRMWSEGYSFDDFFSCSAISLPLTSNSQPTAFPCAHIKDDNHEWPDHTSVLDIDPQAFIVPADARCRFARLISEYDLAVVNRNKAVLGAGLQDAHQSVEASHKERATGASSEAASKRWAVAEPRWMLCSQMGSCEQAMES